MSRPRLMTQAEYDAGAREYGATDAAMEAGGRMIEMWRYDFEDDERSDLELATADDGPFGMSPTSQEWRDALETNGKREES